MTKKRKMVEGWLTRDAKGAKGAGVMFWHPLQFERRPWSDMPVWTREYPNAWTHADFIAEYNLFDENNKPLDLEPGDCILVEIEL